MSSASKDLASQCDLRSAPQPQKEKGQNWGKQHTSWFIEILGNGRGFGFIIIKAVYQTLGHCWAHHIRLGWHCSPGGIAG